MRHCPHKVPHGDSRLAAGLTALSLARPCISRPVFCRDCQPSVWRQTKAERVHKQGRSQQNANSHSMSRRLARGTFPSCSATCKIARRVSRGSESQGSRLRQQPCRHVTHKQALLILGRGTRRSATIPAWEPTQGSCRPRATGSTAGAAAPLAQINAAQSLGHGSWSVQASSTARRQQLLRSRKARLPGSSNGGCSRAGTREKQPAWAQRPAMRSALHRMQPRPAERGAISRAAISAAWHICPARSGTAAVRAQTARL